MNENGYPENTGSLNPRGNSATEDRGTQNNAPNGAPLSENTGGCGGEGCPHDLPLAYLYAPDQRFRMLFSATDALSHGTLFEELFKPMGVYGHE